MDDVKTDHNGRHLEAPITPPPEYRGLALQDVFDLDRKDLIQDLDVPTFDHIDVHGGPDFDHRLEHQVQRSHSPSRSHARPPANEYRCTSEIATTILTRQREKNGSTSTKIEQSEDAHKISKPVGIPNTLTGSSAISGDDSRSPGLENHRLIANIQPVTSRQQPPVLLSTHETSKSTTRSPSLSSVYSSIAQERTDEPTRQRNLTLDAGHERVIVEHISGSSRPRIPRAFSTPSTVKSPIATVPHEGRKSRATSRSEQPRPHNAQHARHALPSPIPSSIPLPPLSLSTYLQLELSSQRPSSLYINRPASSDFPYESSRAKLERLLNFLLLPMQLEAVLWFGALACLDVWLYTFTILPLRMIKSIHILVRAFAINLTNEARFLLGFVYAGSQRVWFRRTARSVSEGSKLSRKVSDVQVHQTPQLSKTKSRLGRYHRRTKSTPSNLMPDDKADLLKGLLIIATCAVLLRFDASRMYHWVRGQAAIKLYVIYNLLEVCDRLLAALGQDVLECLFSREALERKPDGRSKVLRPMWLFGLALVYCVAHATALFYQVVTLNVAVNSYSNALITLLMSNQFVEIKGTVFKKFEKENLFQLTCADVVERFQLWHMLIIIASRNIVETGAFTMGTLSSPFHMATATASNAPNVTQAAPPLTATTIMPRSFMILPSMFSSVTAYVPVIGHVLGPFIIVLGSEMIIDWLKHAYIGKFNNTRPIIYARFLDILTKDYYINAFAEQNLTKRLGLPVIPLSCLMIRASFQTYQMLMASWVPSPSISNEATLASIHQQYSTTSSVPTSTASKIVRTMDDIWSQLPAALSDSRFSSYLTTCLVLVLMFLVLLVFKLCLGMFLLAVSRARYRSMTEREGTDDDVTHVDGARRVGGWGAVEVDEEKRRIIYDDDPVGLQTLKAKEAKGKAKLEQDKERSSGWSATLSSIRRFELSAGAKRIW